ncbi:MAG: type I 3-dehydroquinate dehydratase [Deltaproteobacteria bacterium]|nr:type I 3-dehydroquinate dehydratase [Deltaproteobacteria bacterium]
MTGTEGTLEALRRRLKRDAELAKHQAVDVPLEEIRLDHLVAIDDDTFAWLASVASERTLVATCRPVRQGGAFRGSEPERLALLRRASASELAMVDVEADVDDAFLGELGRTAAVRRGKVKRMLSWHEHSGFPKGCGERLRDMARRDVDLVKLAVTVSDASELDALDACRARTSKPCVLVAMGTAGVLTRTHYPAFGSPFSYVASQADLASAPGQLTLEQALALGLPRSSTAPLFGLVGGAQVQHSPGPRLINRLFRRRGMASSYIPIVTSSLRATLPLLERLDARGLAVTMPLKREALEVARPDPLAREVGAANSLRRREGWEATNTDVTGVRAPLEKALARLDARCARILGAGGAARAAAAACRSLGLTVEVAARRLDEAEAVASGRGRALAWSERTRGPELARSVLINATPLTGHASPWPDEAPLDVAAVFDTALGSMRSSLLVRAEASGAQVLGPMDMWLAQAAEQLSYFLDARVTVDELEDLAR